MRAILILCFLFAVTLRLQAEEISAIIQKCETTLIINSPKRVDYEMKKSVKILSPKGDANAILAFDEDNFQRANAFDVTVKDGDGNIVATYSKKDFKRSALITSASSYGEVDRFQLDCRLRHYPYTIEFYFSLQKKTYFDTDYRFSEYRGTRVLQSSFKIFYPVDYLLSYDVNRKEIISVDSSQADGFKELKFELKGEYDGKSESYATESGTPRILIIPKNFEYGGISGSFNSWKEMGLWINDLWAGRDKLSKSAAAEIDKLKGANPDKTDLAKAIYEYTQKNTRYVAIDYGIGGLQTMSAEETTDVGYGDCKALSNFTGTAMRYAGIEAYPALVYGGSTRESIDPDRPMQAFNHVILCLPQINDTTWLECTSNTAPFGYLSDFTDDRYALLLTPNGGKLVKTPAYPIGDNLTVRNSKIDLHSDGTASIQLDLQYTNLAMTKTNFFQQQFSSDKPIKAVKYEVDLPSFDLLSYTADLYKNQKPELTVNCSLNARNVGRKVGAKQLVKPFIMDLPVPDLESDSTRINPVLFRHGYEFTDSISISLPQESTILQPLAEIDNTTKFGTMRIEARLDSAKQELHIVRFVRVNNGEFPAEEYPDLTTFLSLVHASQDAFIILE